MYLLFLHFCFLFLCVSEVQDLASKIVSKWLAIVKGVPIPNETPAPSAVLAPPPPDPPVEEEAKPSMPALKITLKKEGKNRIRSSSEESEHSDSVSHKTKAKAKKPEEKTRSSSHSKDHDKKHRNDSKHKSSSSSSSSSDKHRSGEQRSSSDKAKSSRDKDRDKSSKSSSSSSSSASSKNYLKEKEREKERERTKKKEKEEKDAKLTKIEKDRQLETDQATLARLMVPSINKLGKIPKKADKAKINELKENIAKSETVEKKEKPVAPAPAPEVSKKNISFSIEKRGPSDQKPKTVKTFNAKPRSTGLEEDAKPPPRAKSSSSSTSSKHSSSSSDKKPSKRSSPVKELPPEKKQKTVDSHSSSSLPHATTAGSTSPSEKPKVTPPKPKGKFCLEKTFRHHEGVCLKRIFLIIALKCLILVDLGNLKSKGVYIRKNIGTHTSWKFKSFSI